MTERHISKIAGGIVSRESRHLAYVGLSLDKSQHSSRDNRRASRIRIGPISDAETATSTVIPANASVIPTKRPVAGMVCLMLRATGTGIRLVPPRPRLVAFEGDPARTRHINLAPGVGGAYTSRSDAVMLGL
jgi:hypothetical protein